VSESGGEKNPAQAEGLEIYPEAVAALLEQFAARNC